MTDHEDADGDDGGDGETGDHASTNADLRLDDLTLPQRVFVAAVQNPSRGIFLVILLAFAFSFFIALWMAFPRIGAFVTGIALVVGLAVTAVVALLR
ncbi:hypothetical protein ACERIT_06250 [Halopenitus sp. H-Gu1]|uniref:hypothetical protein n=1 Tax=Halopenitus sp. H-Gu1 TaxID=3242697 RepID=UPI00359DBA04